MTAVTAQAVRDGAFTIRPLQPTIGAEIIGADLSRPLSPEQRDQIKAAVLQYKVVFFRDQDLDQDQHAAFARQFGPLYTHPSTSKAYADKVPAIHKISAAEAAEKYKKVLARQQAEGVPVSEHSWRCAESPCGLRDAHDHQSYKFLLETALPACDHRRRSRSVGVSSNERPSLEE